MDEEGFLGLEMEGEGERERERERASKRETLDYPYRYTKFF
jgi:hypothetical protein